MSATIVVTMYAIGIDVGATFTKVGRIDPAGTILASGQEQTGGASPDALLHSLVSIVRRFRTPDAAPRGVGVGLPGLHAKDSGIIEFSPNLPSLNGMNVGAALSELTRVPVVVSNDAEMSTWGEFSVGAGVGTSDLACLTVGTGVGAGLILNGRLYSGCRGYAGEVGHIPIDPDGPPCRCGSRGCLETLVSAPAIVERARRKMRSEVSSRLHELKTPLTAADIHQAALQGDAVAQATLAEAGRYLGIACAMLINTLNLELIVIGGGVAAAGGFLMDHVLSEAKARSYEQAYRSCRIVHALLGNNAGIVGAALRALDLQEPTLRLS